MRDGDLGLAVGVELIAKKNESRIGQRGCKKKLQHSIQILALTPYWVRPEMERELIQQRYR